MLNVLMALPAPAWGVALRSSTIADIAASSGVITALGAVPLARRLVRRMRRFNAARLQTLAELLAVRVRDGARPRRD